MDLDPETVVEWFNRASDAEARCQKFSKALFQANQRIAEANKMIEQLQSQSQPEVDGPIIDVEPNPT